MRNTSPSVCHFSNNKLPFFQLDGAAFLLFRVPQEEPWKINIKFIFFLDIFRIDIMWI